MRSCHALTAQLAAAQERLAGLQRQREERLAELVRLDAAKAAKATKPRGKEPLVSTIVRDLEERAKTLNSLGQAEAFFDIARWLRLGPGPKTKGRLRLALEAESMSTTPPALGPLAEQARPLLLAWQAAVAAPLHQREPLYMRVAELARELQPRTSRTSELHLLAGHFERRAKLSAERVRDVLPNLPAEVPASRPLPVPTWVLQPAPYAGEQALQVCEAHDPDAEIAGWLTQVKRRWQVHPYSPIDTWHRVKEYPSAEAAALALLAERRPHLRDQVALVQPKKSVTRSPATRRRR